MDAEQMESSERSEEEKRRSPSSPRSSGKTTRHALPPCRVCGAQAKGFHYGVNTCEACKGFFRRSVIRRMDYVCLDDPQRCVVKPGMRKNCAACRYKRCVQVGMALDAIRIGRYTTEKKNRDAMELKAQKVLANEESCLEKDNRKRDDLFKQVTEAHAKNCFEIDVLISAAKKDQESYLLKKENERRVFGVGKPVCFEYFNSLYKSTGIEIDDRLKILEVLLPFLERGLRRHVNFSKDLPGFKSLPMADQLAIIKNTVVETWVISRHFCINTEHGLLSDSEGGRGVTFDVMQIFDDWGELLLKITKRIGQLQLTKEELLIFKVLDMYISDRCQLEAKSQVETMQDAILDLLQDLLKKNHPQDHNLVMARIIAILTELRTLSHFVSKKCEETSFSLVPDKSFPPLLKEILTPQTNLPAADYVAQADCLLGCQKGCCDEEHDHSKDTVSSSPTFFSHMVEPLRQKLTNEPTPSPSDGYQSDETTSVIQSTPSDSMDEGFVSSLDTTVDEDCSRPTHDTHTITDLSLNVSKGLRGDGYHVPQLDGHHG